MVVIKQTNCNNCFNTALGRTVSKAQHAHWETQKQTTEDRLQFSACSFFFSFFLVNIWWSSSYIETNLDHIILQLAPISSCPEEYCVIGKQWQCVQHLQWCSVCVHVIHSIQEVPWPFYYNIHAGANSFSLSHSHPHTHTCTTSSSSSQ